MKKISKLVFGSRFDFQKMKQSANHLGENFGSAPMLDKKNKIQFTKQFFFAHGRGKKSVQGFGAKARRKVTTRKTKT
jgi:hypothetical protein